MRAIDANWVIGALNVFSDKEHGNRDFLLGIASAKEIVENAPTIEPALIRRGRWIHSGFMEVKCSNCGNVFHELEDTSYCPHCGAKMIPTIPKEIIDAVLGEDEVEE